MEGKFGYFLIELDYFTIPRTKRVLLVCEIEIKLKNWLCHAVCSLWHVVPAEKFITERRREAADAIRAHSRRLRHPPQPAHHADVNIFFYVRAMCYTRCAASPCI